MGLYIITHKHIENWNTYFYTPIHVSCNENDVQIQVKDYYPELAINNKYWNELSAQMCIWKYDHDDIKGQVQYSCIPDLDPQDIVNILKTKDFIVHTERIYPNIKMQFCHEHDSNGELWNVIIDILHEKGYPDDLINKWNDYTYIFCRNNFICKAIDFDKYSEWVFDILNKFTNRMGFTSMENIMEWVEKNPCNRQNLIKDNYRIAGYLGERLFTLYLIEKYGDDVFNRIYCPNYITSPKIV